jgi:hypothetical protein
MEFNGTEPTPLNNRFAGSVVIGQLLLIGNSGWLADEGAPKPAQGLAPHHTKATFSLR